MAKPLVSAGGGFSAIRYTLRKGREAGGLLKLYRRLRSRNACKTCAFGMGGQSGGMVNEQGSFPEVCKKSIQAQAADMQQPIPETFFRERSIRELERLSSMQLEYAGRLTFPLVWNEGDTHFHRIAWAEALDRVAAALRASPPEQTFFYASGRSSNEAAFLMQLLARAYGTRNIHNCSCYCHNASGVALTRVLGSGAGTVVLEDLDRADLALIAGANPASNHPRLIVKLIELRQRGGKVIIVNPLKELGLVRFRVPSKPGSLLFGSTVSDLYLQPHIGSDVALFRALLKGVLERDGADHEFLGRHVDGWEAVEADVRQASWDSLLHACGLQRLEVDRAVEALVAARKGVLLWAMGLTHHEHGVSNVLALANIALARGWLGREGCGLLPIRGHSNVQGIGSVGFTPALKQALAAKIEEVYGVPADAPPGLDTYASMEAAHAGKIRAAVLLGGNLYASNPDSSWARAAMQRIGLTAYLTTKLNLGHIHGRGRSHLLLPVLARDEEQQSTSQESMFSYVRLSQGGQQPPPGELKSEVEIVCALAGRLLGQGPLSFNELSRHQSIREAMARVLPGFEALAQIDDTRKEFQIAGRTFHEPRFPTPNGRLRAQVPATPRFQVANGEFRLMTVRSEGQFNTVVYEEEDIYRGNRRRDVVMMNAADAVRLGLRENDAVTVESPTGRLRVAVSFADLPPGNLAMYYPEANTLVPRRIDEASGTPAFKSIAVRIRR